MQQGVRYRRGAQQGVRYRRGAQQGVPGEYYIPLYTTLYYILLYTLYHTLLYYPGYTLTAGLCYTENDRKVRYPALREGNIDGIKELKDLSGLDTLRERSLLTSNYGTESHFL